MKNRGFFTLIELLVVIAIIAILMSLLLPSLKMAKDKAREAVCLSSQKQLGTVCALYGDDNQEWIPDAWNHFNPAVYAFTGKSDSMPDGWLWQYYSKHEMLQCPTGFIIPEANYPTSWGVCRWNIGLNGRVCQVTGWGPSSGKYKYSKFFKPYEMVLGADVAAEFYATDNSCTMLFDPSINCGVRDFRRYRHSNGIVLLFLDGHALWHSQNDSIFDSGKSAWGEW